jgi:hypothetical protein
MESPFCPAAEAGKGNWERCSEKFVKGKEAGWGGEMKIRYDFLP